MSNVTIEMDNITDHITSCILAQMNVHYQIGTQLKINQSKITSMPGAVRWIQIICQRQIF